MIIKNIEQEIEKVDITGPAPEEEPYRQYYFMQKCRELLKKQEEKEGHKLTSYSVCFGCQMNTLSVMKKTAEQSQII